MIDPAHEAWRRYTSTGAIPPQLLRAPIYRAWQRSHEGGADPHRPVPERLSEPEKHQLLERQRDLITRAQPFLKVLSRAAGEQPHAAVIANAQAVVLAVTGTAHDVCIFEPGTLCAEEFSGTNGIGLTVAEQRYVEVIRAEHFIQGLHAFACQAAPVRGPDGHLVAVLSTALHEPRASARLRDLFLCSTAGLEAELLLVHLEEAVGQVRASAQPRSEELERLRQDIVQAHAAARIHLSLASRTSGDLSQRTARLLLLANQALRRFRRLAAFWRTLAGSEPDDSPSLDLAANLWLLRDLLETELATRDVKLDVEGPDRGPELTAPMFRQLFHWVMAALDLAGAGGLVRLRVRRTADGAWYSGDSLISFDVTPGPAQPDRTRRHWELNARQLADGPSMPPGH